MEISVEKRKEYVRRLLISRTRLLVKNGFFGLLLMNVEFALDEEMPTAATDGDKIYFSPDFLESLDDKQLDFVLMHEVMHMALSHCVRGHSRRGDLLQQQRPQGGRCGQDYRLRNL